VTIKPIACEVLSPSYIKQRLPSLLETTPSPKLFHRNMAAPSQPAVIDFTQGYEYPEGAMTPRSFSSGQITPGRAGSLSNAALEYFESQRARNSNVAQKMPEIPAAFRRKAANAVAAYIYRLGVREGWMSEDVPDAGVVMRTDNGHTDTFPRDADLDGWQSVAEQLSTEVSATQPPVLTVR
jgi:hypothetical protein